MKPLIIYSLGLFVLPFKIHYVHIKHDDMPPAAQYCPTFKTHYVHKKRLDLHTLITALYIFKTHYVYIKLAPANLSSDEKELLTPLRPYKTVAPGTIS